MSVLELPAYGWRPGRDQMPLWATMTALVQARSDCSPPAVH